MKKTLSSTSKIRFQNCDPFNHLNNSSYIDYFINAREDQILENYNLDMYSHIREHQAGWVVGSNQIAYLKPAWLMETILIESELIQYTPTDLLVEMKMWDERKTHLKSILWSRFTYFDLKTQKRKEHPSELIKLFEDVIVPHPKQNFEERCASVLYSLKKQQEESMAN